MSAVLAASDTEDGVVYLDDLKAPQEGVQGQSEGTVRISQEYLEIPEAKRLDCCHCGCPSVRRATWLGLPARTKELLTRAGVRKIESRELCSVCYKRMKNAGRLEEFAPSDWGKVQAAEQRHKKVALHKSVDLKTMWQEVRDAGGSYGELAQQLGCSREYARQMVRDQGLPMIDNRTRTDGRDYFLEELDHLLGFGLGVYEIAQRFNLTPDHLVRKVAKLRERGLTDIRFDTYMEVAAA